MELSVEFKFEDNADLELDSEAAQSLSGQLLSHVAALSGSHYMRQVSQNNLGWERCYRLYTKFLHYIPDVDRRGHDPAVTIISKRKVNEADQKTMEYNSKLHRHFWIVLIPDRDVSRESGFLISCPPKYTRCAPFGRAARQMVVYDLKRSLFVFVTAKDYWRPVGSDRERDIYETFVGRNSVLHIRDNVTLTDQLRDESSTCEMVALRNYRLSLSEVGRQLTEFKSSREFVKAVADAMKADDAAFFDAGILHRDISVRNVIITAQSEGVLIDWDLCVNLWNQDDNVAAHPLKQTGTWQFMSAALLSDPQSNQIIEDGRESAFYLLLYLGLRYTKHNQVQDLESFMDIFDYMTVTHNEGGVLKRVFLVAYSPADALAFQCSPLNDLIGELRTTLSVRYMCMPPGPPFEAYVAEHKNKLQERGWLVNVIDKYLGGADWPDADVAELDQDMRWARNRNQVQRRRRW